MILAIFKNVNTVKEIQDHHLILLPINTIEIHQIINNLKVILNPKVNQIKYQLINLNLIQNNHKVKVDQKQNKYLFSQTLKVIFIFTILNHQIKLLIKFILGNEKQ
jgi:hypothetical protein